MFVNYPLANFPRAAVGNAHVKVTHLPSQMSVLPKVKGPRQGDYAVSYYALGREPTASGLYGYFINVGTFDDKGSAIKAAEAARLKLKHIGGIVRVHETGVAEPLLGQEASSAREKSLVSEDVNSMYSQQQREEREKQLAARQEMEERKKALEEETAGTEDQTSLEYYAKLHVNRRMLEESVLAQEISLRAAQKKLAAARNEILEKDSQFPAYSGEWRDFFRSKLGKGVGDPFFLTERVTASEA